MNNNLPSDTAAFVAAHAGAEFRPFAYYDKHLDCIRVQLLDCSIKEERKNRFITFLYANHFENNKSAGFNIKGVRYLFEKVGLPQTGVYKLVDLIDRLVSIFPDASLKHVQETFRPILSEQDLAVEF